MWSISITNHINMYECPIVAYEDSHVIKQLHAIMHDAERQPASNCGDDGMHQSCFPC